MEGQLQGLQDPALVMSVPLDLKVSIASLLLFALLLLHPQTLALKEASIFIVLMEELLAEPQVPAPVIACSVLAVQTVLPHSAHQENIWRTQKFLPALTAQMANILVWKEGWLKVIVLPVVLLLPLAMIKPIA
jgi:hypothetical protein